MNLTEFYDALALALATTPGVKVRRQAHEIGAYRIYANGWAYCPITFVAHQQGHPKYSLGLFHEAGKALGLRKRDRERIVDSNDNHADPAFSLRTRQTLTDILSPYLVEKPL